MSMTVEEVWKNVVGYEGLYQVSNLGNVRSVDRNIFNGKTLAKKRGKTMKSYVVRNGYVSTRLSKNGEVKNCLVHRLVAMAFIPNPNNLPQVNHKDENKQNNHVDNLEWCDRLYNNNYGTAKARHSASKKENPPNAILYEYENEVHSLKEWAKIKNVSYDKVKRRYKKGFRGGDLFE